jgi:predicted permease
VPLKIKFIIFQLVIILPFAIGYISRRFIKKKEDTAKKIIRINLLSIEPLIVLWSIWGLTLSFDHVFLPLSGLSLAIAGFLIGTMTILFTDRKDTGRKTYLISSSLANHGFTMGGLICYLIAGEQGLGLSSIFTLYFVPYTFLFIFNYARTNTLKKIFSIEGFIGNFLNLQNMPLHAVLTALILHLIGLKRPDINFPVDALLLISISLYYFTLGLNFSFGDFRSTGKDQLLLAVTKFLILPLITFSILKFTRLDPEVKTIIFVQSFMPAAVYSVVTSILFDLDSKLASSIFFINTIIFLISVLPALLFFRGNPGF